MNAAHSSLRIVLLGYIVRGPLGGLAWHHLQYAMGLRSLGHDVTFLEDSDDYPSCYDPERDVTDTDPTYGLRFATEVFDRVGLGQRWAYFDAHTSAWHGPAAAEAPERCRTAEVLINLSAVNPLRDWHMNVPVRALVDTDPGFTQARIIAQRSARALTQLHTHFLSFAGNLGDGAELPVDGIEWRPTRQPVVLSAWTSSMPPTTGRLTTVMQWESYPAARFGSRVLGLKSKSFEIIRALPERYPGLLEVALGSANAPRDELRDEGWQLSDPLSVSRDPWTYQAYLGNSVGEFSVAKDGYVSTCSGWFSERTTGYMALGRPVVIQDTGFTRWLPSGEGVLPFFDFDSAVAAIDNLLSDPARHGRRARELVEAYFDADDVLTELLDAVHEPQERPS